jgi:hypothetical protein
MEGKWKETALSKFEFVNLSFPEKVEKLHEASFEIAVLQS